MSEEALQSPAIDPTRHGEHTAFVETTVQKFASIECLSTYDLLSWLQSHRETMEKGQTGWNLSSLLPHIWRPRRKG